MRYRAPRFPAHTDIKIMTVDGIDQALLRNVSAQGMCITGLTTLQYGERVRVSVAGELVDAKVVWTQMNSVGMRLARDLDETEICFLRQVPTGTGRPPQGGPGSFTEM